jgi:hypothetical protein
MRLVDFVVRRVNQMEGNSITRGRGKPRKKTRKTIKEYLEVNGLAIKMIYIRKLLCRLSHLVDPN